MIIYVARQPIFDRQLKVYGYELLYRSDMNNQCPGNDTEQRTAAVTVDSFMSIGIDAITRGKRAFVNFSKPLLNQGAALLMPSALLVVEVDEDVVPDQYTIAACAALKELGYLLVLNNITLQSKAMPLLEMANMVSLDFRDKSPEDQQTIIDYLEPYRKKILAKKIETPVEYRRARDLGYNYFQGHFFCQPEVFESKDIPAVKLHYMQLLQEIYKIEVDFDRLEKLIKQDVSLTYKLLKFINSMEFQILLPVRSIRQALTLLGQKNIIKWASLVTLRSMGLNKPNELIVTAMARARFCEELALQTDLKKSSDDLFLIGLFSLLDVFLGRTMENILNELPLTSQIKDVLLGKTNDISDIFYLVLAYERADWNQVDLIGNKLKLAKKTILKSYLIALKQTDLVSG